MGFNLNELELAVLAALTAFGTAAAASQVPHVPSWAGLVVLAFTGAFAASSYQAKPKAT